MDDPSAGFVFYLAACFLTLMYAYEHLGTLSFLEEISWHIFYVQKVLSLEYPRETTSLSRAAKDLLNI